MLWDFVSSRPEYCLSHLCIPFLIMYATFYYVDYSVASSFLLCTSQLFWLYVPVALFSPCGSPQAPGHTVHLASYVRFVENAACFVLLTYVLYFAYV